MGDYTAGDLIEVVWIDVEQDTEYQDSTKKRSSARTKFITPGYYAREDEDYLYFTYALGVEGNTDYMNWTIPLGCIKNVKKIPV